MRVTRRSGQLGLVMLLVGACSSSETANPPTTITTEPEEITSSTPIASSVSAPTTTVSFAMSSTTSSISVVATTAASPTGPLPRPTPSAPTTAVASQTRVVTLTIPLGTAQRILDGDDVGEILPASLTLQVGDRLVIVNNDDAFHTYGPLSARNGETVQYEFRDPGDYFGYCTTNSTRAITITVTDRA